MNQRRISEATLRVRDALYEGLLLRAGLVIDEQVARERANNLATAVLEVLRQLAPVCLNCERILFIERLESR